MSDKKFDESTGYILPEHYAKFVRREIAAEEKIAELQAENERLLADRNEVYANVCKSTDELLAALAVIENTSDALSVLCDFVEQAGFPVEAGRQALALTVDFSPLEELKAGYEAAIEQMREDCTKVPRKHALALADGIFGARFPDEATAICNASTNMADAICALPLPVPSEALRKHDAKVLREAGAILELYDDATVTRADHMLCSTECAQILEQLAAEKEKEL